MKNELDGFDRVWDRVMKENRPRPPRPDKPECECRELRRFMEEAAQAEAVYRDLARRSRDRRNSALFMELARDEEDTVRLLQSAYFLLTGDSFRPRPKPIRQTGMLTAIREQYRRELKSAEMYEDAARENKIPNLSQVFKSIIQKERHHAEILADLIKKIMR